MNSNWLPAAACVGFFLAVVLIVVALAPLIRERREARRQAYMEQCTATGFTEPQCRLLWDAKRAADDAQQRLVAGYRYPAIDPETLIRLFVQAKVDVA